MQPRPNLNQIEGHLIADASGALHDRHVEDCYKVLANGLVYRNALARQRFLKHLSFYAGALNDEIRDYKATAVILTDPKAAITYASKFAYVTIWRLDAKDRRRYKAPRTHVWCAMIGDVKVSAPVTGKSIEQVVILALVQMFRIITYGFNNEMNKREEREALH